MQPAGQRRPVSLGGIVHAYQKYDPRTFPPPTQPAPDLAGAAFEHMLRFGSLRQLTEEELARAIRLDPSQIAGLGPSLEALIELLEQRKQRILETYEADTVRDRAAREVSRAAADMHPPPALARRFARAVRDEQIHELERIWYALPDQQSVFARQLLRLRDRLGDKYLIDELGSKYAFTGRTPMDVPTALAVREELETIDRLLEQLREALKTARIGIIDLDELARFVDEADVRQLEALRQQVEQYVREQAEAQGLERSAEGYRLTPRAYRIFQSRLLQTIFGSVSAARSGRHDAPIIGDGAVELPSTRPYQFGDSLTHMDIPQTFVNALLRRAGLGRERASPPQQTGRLTLRTDDIVVHQTRNRPRCATAVLMDMSGSMRYDGQYIAVKRMALGLDGLIRSEFPGDYLDFIEVYSFARRCHIAEVPELLPRPVTTHGSVVRLKVDMSDPRITELHVPPHFTNIQRGLAVARQLLGAKDTPNRQIVLLTDGLPTAHFDGSWLYLLYPPDPLTERATLREAQLCAREGITINVFLLPNWWQDEDDIAFGHRLAEQTGGRVFFTAGRDVDRFVLWDYVAHRRAIIG